MMDRIFCARVHIFEQATADSILVHSQDFQIGGDFSKNLGQEKPHLENFLALESLILKGQAIGTDFRDLHGLAVDIQSDRVFGIGGDAEALPRVGGNLVDP